MFVYIYTLLLSSNICLTTKISIPFYKKDNLNSDVFRLSTFSVHSKLYFLVYGHQSTAYLPDYHSELIHSEKSNNKFTQNQCPNSFSYITRECTNEYSQEAENESKKLNKTFKTIKTGSSLKEVSIPHTTVTLPVNSISIGALWQSTTACGTLLATACCFPAKRG